MVVLKEQIINLKARKKQLEMEQEKVDKAFKALQELCDHKHEDGKSASEVVGNDSHSDKYECSICGNSWVY